MKELLDNVERLCDDLKSNELKNNTKSHKMIPLSDLEEISSSENTLDTVDPEKMKSINELDRIGEGEDSTDKTWDSSLEDKLNNELTVPENMQTVESDQETKPDEELKEPETNLESFKDHGVISLHYPDEDARSVDSLDVDDTQRIVPDQVNDAECSHHEDIDDSGSSEYVNQQGVRFTPQEAHKEGTLKR